VESPASRDNGVFAWAVMPRGHRAGLDHLPERQRLGAAGHHRAADAIVGDTVCHSGNTAPNWECGTVTAVNQTIDYVSVVVDGLTTTTACSEGGDSGGAWLRGDEAVGVHSGGNSTCSPYQDNSIFQPINEALAKWNLTLLTGSNDPGDPDPGERTYANGTKWSITV